MENHTLPMDLMREILLRLPVRSVSRFKCVCKSWLSIISDPQFGNSHYDLAAAPSHRLILRSKCYSLEVQSIDTDAPPDTCSAAMYLLLPLQSPPPKPNDYDNYDGLPNRAKILGFILLYYEMSRDLIMWNPLTRFRKRSLNFENMLTHRFLYGFGYDTSTDDYLLIMIPFHWKTEIQVFSFKTNSRNRKMIKLNVPYQGIGSKFSIGSLLNETLHWLVFSKDKWVDVIIAFDLIKRSLSEIALFDHLTKKKYEMFSLRVIGGCLSVSCSDQDWAMTEIWIMKEYKVQSSWTKSFVIPTYGFSPICITKDGGILGSNMRERLEKHNDKGELLEHLACVAAAGEEYYCANQDQQSAMYRESQLFPNVSWETSEDHQQ
uniref:F-box domain-containing protein n=2 Tax=Glycine max TaxID=3847 RepID=A0A0R0ISF1_SOYBN